MSRGASDVRGALTSAAEGGQKEMVRFFTHAGAKIINETLLLLQKEIIWS